MHMGGEREGGGAGDERMVGVVVNVHWSVKVGVTREEKVERGRDEQGRGGGER